MKLENIRRAIKYGLVLDAILWRLEKIGILIQPYYIVREAEMYLHDNESSEPVEGYTLCQLGKEAVDELAALDGYLTPKQLRRRLDRGHVCFGIRKQSRIVASMWCDLQEFDYDPCRRRLEENEAYLYAVYVDPDIRGQGLASYFRFEVYRALKRYSKDTFFSYSEYNNTSAIRFKQKLGAHFLQLCLYLNLWNKFSRNWVLRDYTKSKASRKLHC